MPVLAVNASPTQAPTPRHPAMNGARPRPLSMPMTPQQYVSAGGPPGGGELRTPIDAPGSGQGQSQGQGQAAATPSAGGPSPGSRSQKSRSSNRVLGDYTLGKTLGAGSMGKVKLAYHNSTGEKVWMKDMLPACTFLICIPLACDQDSSPHTSWEHNIQRCTADTGTGSQASDEGCLERDPYHA